MELVDTLALGASVARREGSSPFIRTRKKITMKLTQQSLIDTGIEVGAWKLEADSRKHKIYKNGDLHTACVHLCGVIAADKVFNKVSIDTLCDLKSADSTTGASAMFSLSKYRYFGPERSKRYTDYVDIRFTQAVLVAQRPMNLISIFTAEDFMHQNYLIGGRKLQRWNYLEAIGLLVNTAPVPENAPAFDSLEELATVAETYCPTTTQTLTQALQQKLIHGKNIEFEPLY